LQGFPAIIPLYHATTAWVGDTWAIETP